jgi:hypothetical protein
VERGYNLGLWLVKTLWSAGYKVQTHYHSVPVFVVTHSDSWYYKKESPSQVSCAGSYLDDPSPSIRTLLVSEDNTKDTEGEVPICECNVDIDEGGSTPGIVDAKLVLQIY